MHKKWINAIVAVGKRHKWATPLLAVLLGIAATAEWCGRLWHQTARRVMAFALAVCMVFTLLPMNTFAAEGDIPTGSSSLTCHTEHDADCLLCGGESADLLLCTGEGVLIEPVEPSEAAQAVMDLIDALPSVEEIYGSAVSDSDPGYADWLAEMEETVQAIHTAKAAYDALSTGERETMAPEAKEKQLALYDFAQRIPTAAPLSESSEVAELGGKKYNSLQDAINALGDNFYTITLLVSVDASVTVTENFDFKLNLNGNTLSNSTSDSIIKHAGGGTINIINGKDEGGTTITNADGGNAILIQNGYIDVDNGVNIRATDTSSTAIK